MSTLDYWRADFLNSPDELDRRRWPPRRDLFVTVLATDKEDARVRAFAIAKKLLARPYLGELEKGAWL